MNGKYKIPEGEIPPRGQRSHRLGVNRVAYTPSYTPEVASAIEMPHVVASVRMAMCRECEHYNDDANTGQPIDPPCGLATKWRIGGCGCKIKREDTWRGRMMMDLPHPHADCPWNKETEQ